MRKGKRFAVMLVVIALAAVMAISMSACGGGGETDTGGDATPVKLVLDYSKVKTSYDYDEPFTSNGLVVRVEMSDGTRKEVKTGYKVEKPDMTPGQHMVTVTYGELSARYPVFVSDMIKNYDDSEFAVLGAPGLYVVEAEDIDLGKCEASPIDASTATIQRTSSVFVGKKAYLTNFGAAGNCVGFQFDAAADIGNVQMAVKVGNPTDAEIDIASAVAMYADFRGASDMGQLDISGEQPLAPGEWRTIVFDDVSFFGSSNFIIEFLTTVDLAWDGVDFIVGSNGVNPAAKFALPAGSETPVTLAAESMNLEKFSSTDAAISEHSLKFAQPLINDGYVTAIKQGAQLSAMIDLEENSEVTFSLAASIPESYSLADNWTFYVDTFRLNSVADTTATSGKTDVSLGTYALKAGSHMFYAVASGTPCDIDAFTLSATAFTGDESSLVEDKSDFDLTVYEFGTYKVEGEDLLDRSGWVPQFGEVSGMIEAWEWKDGTSGLSIGKVQDGTIIRLSFSLKVAAKLSLTARAAVSGESETGTIPSWQLKATVDDTTLAWTSDHRFGYDTDHTWWNWGDVNYSSIYLQPGDYVLKLENISGIGIDYFTLDFMSPINKIEGFGSVKVEAEDLYDRTDWHHSQSTEDNPKTADDMVEQWTNPGTGAMGMCVTKIKSGSILRIPFETTQRAAVRVNIRVSQWGCSGKIDANRVKVKLGDQYVIWSSDDDFTNQGPESTSETFKEYSYFRWGTLTTSPVVLDAGSHIIEITSGDVSYDWFEVETLDPSAGVSVTNISGAGDYTVQAEDLIADSDIRHAWGPGENNIIGYDPINNSGTVSSFNTKNPTASGYCLTRLAVGSVIRVRFTTEVSVSITLKVRIAEYNSTGDLSSGAMDIVLKGGESDIPVTWSAPSGAFNHDDTTYGLYHWGDATCDTVTVGPGEYVFEINSGDVSYDYFTLSAVAAEQA